MTLLRTHELQRVENEVRQARREVSDVQKSLDELSLQQGGSTNRMRADLTTMLAELQGQIHRLHAEIDETQHRLTQLNQKLDRLDQRKIVVTPADSLPGSLPGVTVLPGLDLEHMFAQAREDYIRGRYDLAYQGFKAVYEKDPAGHWGEQSLFWMAECLWRGNRPDRALEMYHRVVAEFPAGTQRCAAWLKIALLHEERRETSLRDETLHLLIAGCPQSNEAARAREMLEQ